MIPTHLRSPFPGVGHGTAMAHHGEIMQGVYVRPDGRHCRVLVTLPYPQRGAQATFLPIADSPVTVEPVWKSKACRAALLTLAYCGWSGWGGHLVIHSTTPPRWGFGSSTSDVTATIRAVSNVCRVQLPAAVIATLAVQAETASDAIMFENRAVLFAHRNGVVIEDFGAAMPGLEVVGVNTDPTGTGVDTLDTPPAWYSPQELQTFQELVACLRHAIATHDPHLIGQVALVSARINQRHLPKPGFGQLERLVVEVAALGLQVSHSGTVVGLLFDPQDPEIETKTYYAHTGLRRLGFAHTWRFCTPVGIGLSSLSGQNNGAEQT
jgi:uncharacterized protein involved in propanediol utilization